MDYKKKKTPGPGMLKERKRKKGRKIERAKEIDKQKGIRVVIDIYNVKVYF